MSNRKKSTLLAKTRVQYLKWLSKPRKSEMVALALSRCLNNKGKFCPGAVDISGVILTTHFQHTNILNVVAARQQQWSTALQEDCNSSHT